MHVHTYMVHTYIYYGHTYIHKHTYIHTWHPRSCRSSKMWALHQESRQELDEEDAEAIFHEIDVKLKVAAIYLEGLQEEKVVHCTYIQYATKKTQNEFFE